MAQARSTARRYAEAALAIADRDKSVESWLTALGSASQALAGAEISRVLANPALPFPARRSIAEQALGAEVTGPPRNLVLLLVRRGRIELLPSVAREFRRLYERREGIVQATVTSAAPLSSAEVAALSERLAGMTGGRVEITVAVDPAILGGVTVRLGDRLIDGSVRGRLERLRTRLASGAL